MTISVVAADELGDGDSERAANPARSSSLLDRLRAQSAKQQAKRTLDIEIGGAFDPPLVARYGVLPMHELERITDAIDENHPDRVGYALEVMSRCNRAILARDGDELVELTDDAGLVTFGHRLAALLALPIPPDEDAMPAREVIPLLFGGNAMAVQAHGAQLLQWLNQNGTKSGEASAPTRSS